MNSIHRNHRFQVRLASLGAYCDCGDLSAWKTGPCCARHREMALVSSLFSQLLLLERLQTVQTAMETRPRNSQPCRRVFRAGDTVYSCRNCIKTPNTVLCQDCFQNSIHKHHQFEAFVCNVSDGYCDCGDLSAWKTGPCCSKHSSGPSVPSATTAPSGNAVPSSPEPRTCLPQRATASATSAAAPKVSERSKTSKAATTTQTTKPAPLATPQNTRPTPSSARRLSMRKEVSSKVLPPSANEFAQDLRRAQTEAPVKAEESVGAMGTGVRTSAPAQCRRKIKRGENIYSCRDCAMDPTCVLCQDCFQNSGHKSHSYKTRVSSSGSSICSCGDVDGWRSASCCSKHNPDSTQRAPSSACSWDQQEDPVHPRSPLNGCTVTMRAPVCLIDNGLDGRMSVQQEALQILEQIQQPVVVVAVVGLYRTGKSYLMNRLAGQNAGFALGRTIESKTKGIWMWCIPHPLKAGHTLVLLDTEGLGDVQKGDEKHDTWIFCLAVLLSSTLVYNSMGTIDNTALEKLHYVTELTEHIRVKCSEHNRNTELMRIFPSFVWTVRDFTLDLELEGKPITADEYLESALKLKEGSSPEVEKHNKLRQSLRDFFAVRRCFVMERPASGEKMKCVAELTDTDLEPGFVQQAQEFCSYIHHSAQVKTMRGGLGLTGRMLGSLAETYVKAIRSGQVPCLESAVESLALIQNSRAVAESLDYYKKEMKCRVQFPTETQEALSNIHSAVEKQTISIFINVSFNDSEQKYQQELMTTIEEEYNKLCTKNGSKSCEVCKSVISQVFAPLEAGLKNGSYMRPGGFEDFRRALNTGAQLYRSVKCKGVMSEVVLSKYLEKKSGDARGILAADRSLSEAQRKTEENRVKLEEAELQKKRQEQRTQVLQQLMLDQKRSHDENMRQLEEKMERERQNAHEELERVVAAKLMEQKRLQNSGFRERAQGMEEDILKMRQEQKTLKDKKRRWLGRLGSGLQAVGPVAALLPCPGVLIGLAAVAIGSFLKMFD